MLTTCSIFVKQLGTSSANAFWYQLDGQTCWDHLYQVRWSCQPCYKMLTTCSIFVKQLGTSVGERILISAWWTDLLQLACRSVTTCAFLHVCISINEWLFLFQFSLLQLLHQYWTILLKQWWTTLFVQYYYSAMIDAFCSTALLGGRSH